MEKYSLIYHCTIVHISKKNLPVHCIEHRLHALQASVIKLPATRLVIGVVLGRGLRINHLFSSISVMMKLAMTNEALLVVNVVMQCTVAYILFSQYSCFIILMTITIIIMMRIAMMVFTMITIMMTIIMTIVMTIIMTIMITIMMTI